MAHSESEREKSLSKEVSSEFPILNYPYHEHDCNKDCFVHCIKAFFM